jgi:class 3 adenylate cyclase/tetratricopeptide (TPR) repeat protein
LYFCWLFLRFSLLTVQHRIINLIINSIIMSDLIQEGQKYENQVQYNQAEKCYRNVIKNTEQSEDFDSLVWAYYYLAKLLLIKGRIFCDESISLLNKAISICTNKAATLSIVKFFNLLGLASYLKDNLDDGLDYLKESYKHLNINICSVDMAEYYHFSGLIYHKKKERRKSESYLEKAIQIYWSLNDQAGVAKVYDSLGNLEFTQGNLKDAGYYIGESIKIKEKIGDQWGLAISYGNLGRLKMSQGKYPEAEKYFQKDLNLSEEIKDNRGIGIMLNNLGELYYRMEEYKKSIEYYTKSLNQIKDYINSIYANLGIAVTYILRYSSIKNGKQYLVLAKNHCEKAKELIEQVPNNLHKNLYKMVKGMIIWRDGNVKDGKKNLLEANDFFRSKDDMQKKIDVYVELSYLYEKNNEIESAIESIESTFPALEIFGADSLIRKMEKRIQGLDSQALLRVLISRYLPKQIIPSFFQGGGEVLEPQRRNISILFSDIRDFTKLSEKLPAEDVVSILDDYFREMVDVVKEYNGTLDKFIGDAIMVIYGAPETSLDHAKRAVLTALEMIEKLKDFNRRRKRRNLSPINIGIGINSGEAVVGNVGTMERMDYTAIGDTVNLSSRLEGLNKEYLTNIVISENTLSHLIGEINITKFSEESIVPTIALPGGSVFCKFLDKVNVKGKTIPIKIYAVWLKKFVRFKTRFVGNGETLEPKPAVLALDIGGKTVPGVIDHHQAEAEEECTASLIFKNPKLVTDHVQNILIEDVEFVMHRNPDLDTIAAAYLAQKLIEGEELTSFDRKIAEYAKECDSSNLSIKLQPENTVYGILTGINELNKRLYKGVFTSQSKKDLNILKRGIQLIEYSLQKMHKGIDIDNPLLFEGEHPFVDEKELISNDRNIFFKDLKRSTIYEISLPAYSLKQKTKVKMLAIKDPESVMFKIWARGEGYIMTMVNYNERRYIISVDPTYGLSLQGLGVILDKLETKKRSNLGKERKGKNRPGYSNSDPWYDGRSPIHKYTIVDSPRSGTILSEAEIFKIVTDPEKWKE